MTLGLLLDSRVELGIDEAALLLALPSLTLPVVQTGLNLVTSLELFVRTAYTQIIPVIGQVNPADYNLWETAIYEAYLTELSQLVYGGNNFFYCTLKILFLIFFC